MFKTGRFSRITCKDRNCYRSFCLFDHSLILAENTSKSTQTESFSEVTKKRKVVITPLSGPLPSQITQKVITELSEAQSGKTPEIEISLHSKIPRKIRQKSLTLFYNQFLRIYPSQKLASRHAIEQELDVYQRSTIHSYTSLSMGVLTRLKRRDQAVDENDVGIDGIYKKPNVVEPDPIPDLERFIMSRDDMQIFGYPLECGQGHFEIRGERICDRCGIKFLPQDLSDDPILATACKFHWGKKKKLGFERVYSCCSGDNLAEPCSIGPHVFKPELKEVYKTKRFTSLKNADGIAVVGIDCEMSYTTTGMECVRVTVVDWNGTQVYDSIVKPEVPIIDYNTRFSGVKSVEGGKKLCKVREELDQIIGTKSILVGHGLENDLATLGIVHYRCIDTAHLFPHPSGMPYRMGLAVLAKENLKRFIQDGQHDSAEDAKACIDLVKFKISLEYRVQ